MDQNNIKQQYLKGEYTLWFSLINITDLEISNIFSNNADNILII